MDPRRFAGLPYDAQRREREAILLADPLVRDALQRAREFDLPDWMIVSGAIYNSVWNALTGREPGYGIKDVDLFYFDGSDLSWEAEDAVIKAGGDRFAGLAVPAEIRNQARVHLWYESRFGRRCPAYENSAHSLQYFASKTHAVGVRLLEDGNLAVTAPFGLDHVFSLEIVPNRALDNRDTYMAKAKRASSLWPQVTVESW